MGDAKIEPTSTQNPASPSSPSSPASQSPIGSPKSSDDNGRKKPAGGDEPLENSEIPSSSSMKDTMQAMLKRMPSMQDVKNILENPEEAKKKLNVFVDGVSKKIFPAKKISNFQGVQDGEADPRIERIQIALELSHADLTKMFMLLQKC